MVTVFLPTATPLGGVCPACGELMDESGCRVVERAPVPQPNALGVAQIVRVDCLGIPVITLVPCPCCAASEEEP